MTGGLTRDINSPLAANLGVLCIIQCVLMGKSAGGEKIVLKKSRGREETFTVQPCKKPVCRGAGAPNPVLFRDVLWLAPHEDPQGAGGVPVAALGLPSFRKPLAHPHGLTLHWCHPPQFSFSAVFSIFFIVVRYT